jgi:hypothetical protein
MSATEEPTANHVRQAIAGVLSFSRPEGLDIPELSREGDERSLGLVVRAGPRRFRLYAGWGVRYALAEGEDRWSLLRCSGPLVGTRWYAEPSGGALLRKVLAHLLSEAQADAARYLWTEQWFLRSQMLDDDDTLAQELTRPEVDASPTPVAGVSVFYFETERGPGHLSRMADWKNERSVYGVSFPE